MPFVRRCKADYRLTTPICLSRLFYILQLTGPSSIGPLFKYTRIFEKGSIPYYFYFILFMNKLVRIQRFLVTKYIYFLLRFLFANSMKKYICRLSPNSEKDPFLACAGKPRSFKTGLSRDQSYRLSYLFWQKLVFTLQIGDDLFLNLNSVVEVCNEGNCNWENFWCRHWHLVESKTCSLSHFLK